MAPGNYVIFGAGGHGKVVLDAALAAGEKVTCLVDDDPGETELWGIRIRKCEEDFFTSLGDFDFIVAVGHNIKRSEIFQRLMSLGGVPKSVIHPRTIISKMSRISEGTVVCAGVVVNPGTHVGRNCILNTSASIDHDCEVGDHVHICPGVTFAGSVSVGEYTMIGTGSVVLPGVKIGERSVVGAGSVVVKDIPSGVVAYGNPAKARRELRAEERL